MDVAHGTIQIDVNDGGVEAELRKIQAEVKAAAAAIGRTDAEVKIKGNVKDLSEAIAQAKAELASLRNEDAKLALQQKNAGKEAADRIRKQRDLNRQEMLDRKSKILDMEAEKRQADKLLRTQQDVNRETDKAIKLERAVATAHEKSNRVKQRGLELQRQEMVQIPRMQAQYAQLQKRLEDMGKARRRATPGSAQELRVKLNESSVMAQMTALKAALKAKGADAITIDTRLSKGALAGKFIRDAFNEGGWKRAATAAGIAMGTSLGTGVGEAMHRAVSPSAMVRTFSSIGAKAEGFLGRISQMAVRVGPFTASLRQFGLALSVLGPTLVDLTGSLGALVSVVGSGAMGLGALTVGFLGGAIPAALGFFAVLKPIQTEFKNAMKASKAYNDALTKGNTTLAAKKLKEFNAVMGNQSAETKKAFLAAGTLRDRWKDATKPATQAAFGTIGKALQAASDNMGTFASKTNTGMKAATEGVNQWIKGLTSGEGKAALGAMMDNFNKMIPATLHGLGQIGTFFGRVGREGSRWLPYVSRGFDRWSKSMADSVGPGKDLSGKIREMMGSLKSVGRFTMAGGRLLKNFFAGGVKAGQSFADTMTHAMNRWSASFKTGEGQQKLQDFFQRSVSGAQALYKVLAPIGASFVQWASNLSPVVTAAMNGIGAVSGFVREVLKLTGLSGAVSTVAFTLGALWSVSKISAAAAQVGNFVKALGEAKVATEALAGAQAIEGGIGAAAGGAGRGAVVAEQRMMAGATLASDLAMARAGQTAAQTGAKYGLLRTAATKLVPAIGGLGAMAGGIATAGVMALGAAAAYGVYKLVTIKPATQKYREEIAKLGQEHGKLRGNMRETIVSLYDSARAQRDATLSVRDAQKAYNDSKPGSRERVDALNALRDGWQQQNQAQKDASTLANNYRNQASQLVTLDQKRAEAGRKLTEAQKAQADQEQRNTQVRGGGATSKKAGEEAALRRANDVIAAQAEYDRLNAAATRSANIQAAAEFNVARVRRNQVPLIAAQEQALGRLARTNAAVAGQVSRRYEAPSNVAKVSNAANAALRSGVSQTKVVNIIANSKNAEQAIARLRVARIPTKQVNVIERGGKAAVATLQRIAGRKLTNKEFRAVMKGGTEALAVLARIIGKKVPNKSFSAKAKDLATAVIQAIIGKKIPTKTSHIRAKDLASAIISAVKSEIASIPPSASSTITVTHITKWINETHSVKVAQGGIVGAASGMSGRRRKKGRFRTRGNYASALIRGADGADMSMLERTQQRAQARAANKAAVPSNGSVYRTPTLLVGEENRPEFVIATNPAYRERNQQLVRMAASAVGVETAATGRHARKKPKPGSDQSTKGRGKSGTGQNKGGINRGPGSTGRPAKPNSPVKATDWQRGWLGAISVDRAQKMYDKYWQPWQDARQQVKDWTNKKAHGSTAEKTAAPKKIKYWTKIASKRAVPATFWRDTLAHVQRWNTQLDGYDTSISILSNLMSTTRNPSSYENYRGQKHDLIVKARNLLREAIRRIGGRNGSTYYRNQLMERYTALGGTLNEVGGLGDALKGFDPEANDMTLEQWLLKIGGGKSGGAYAKYKGLLTAQQQAAATGPTATDLTGQADDKAAAAKLAEFLGGFESRVLATNDNGLIGGFYDALTGARSAAGLLEDQTPQNSGGNNPDNGPTADQQAVIDQLKRQVSTATQSQRIAEAFSTVAGRGGDMGFGGFSGRAAAGAGPNGPWGGGGPTFIINTLHPGDPGTLSAIGDAATAGMGYQGYVTSPRLNTGL